MIKTWPHATLSRLAVIGALAATLATSLSGCFPIIVGAVAYSSYAATDRRSLGAQTDDKVIGIRAENQLGDRFGAAAHITVTSFNRRVLLTGQVLDEASKAEAEAIVRQGPEVKAVVNELTISSPSSYGERSNDAFITTQVKAAMVNHSDIFANAYKVVTERGVVYLMGLVTRREGDYAADIARGVSGVTAVVKVFDYISEDDLQRMQTQAVPTDTSAPPPPGTQPAAPAGPPSGDASSPPATGPGAPAQ
jgi:osmotically-inducible protein OsmY